MHASSVTSRSIKHGGWTSFCSRFRFSFGRFQRNGRRILKRSAFRCLFRFTGLGACGVLSGTTLKMSAQSSDFTLTLDGLGLQIAAAKKLSLELRQLLAWNQWPQPLQEFATK